MKILAIDTSGQCGVVGLSDGENTSVEISATSRESHSARLLPSIDMALELSGWKLDEIDLFGVVVGPGSFTGLRVGVATIKGLAISKRKPVVPINSLEALAWGAPSSQKLICPMLDARRGRVFGAIYQLVNEQMKEIVSQQDTDPIDLIKRVSTPLLCLGEGAIVFEPELLAFPHVEIGSRAFRTPKGSILCNLTQIGFHHGKATEIGDLDPLYLSLSEAERQEITKTL